MMQISVSMQGHFARWLGTEITKNPYRFDDPRWTDWADGWYDLDDVLKDNEGETHEKEIP